ncbi:hypothetical protein COOONC_26275 [Cooperia oncophora]
MTRSKASTTKPSDSERPPTRVGSPGCSSESENNISFDTATLIGKSRRKSSSTISTIQSTGKNAPETTSTSSSYVPPQRTPDPVKLAAAKKASESSKLQETAQKQENGKKGKAVDVKLVPTIKFHCKRRPLTRPVEKRRSKR